MTGLFISFEGIDGVGKSTQAERLRDFLTASGQTVTVTREPGGTQLGRAIRRLLLSNEPGAPPVSPQAEALLYAADRAQHAQEVIKPALSHGEIVITDRYLDSSLAYQAGGRQFSDEDIAGLSMWATGGLIPVRTYLLDLDPRLSHRRLTGDPDRLESEPDAFQERTRQAFLDRAAAEPQRFLVVDAAQSIDAVWDVICADAQSLMGERLA